ncbi:hypothetical protein D3C80_1557450 [compost metagenome]
MGDVQVFQGQLMLDSIGTSQEALDGICLASYPVMVIRRDAGASSEEQRAVEAPHVDHQRPGIRRSPVVEKSAELPRDLFIKTRKLKGFFLANQKR